LTHEIHLDPQINYENYPVPSDLLIAARDDLIKRSRKMRHGMRISRIITWENTIAQAGKTISVMREWYVDQVMFQVWDKFTKGSDEINRRIKINFSDPDKLRKLTGMLQSS